MKVGDIVKIKTGVFAGEVVRVIEVDGDWASVIVKGGRVAYKIRDLEKQ